MPPTSQTPRVAIFNGFRLHDGRRAGFCWGGRAQCVAGHRLVLRDVLLTDTIVTCQHRTTDRQGPCGIRQYVKRWLDADQLEAWLVVEVTDDHVRMMRDQPMRFMQKLSILDCVLPGVDIDFDPSQRNNGNGGTHGT